MQTSVSNARAGVSGQVPTLSSALDDFSSASSSMRGSLDTLRGQRDQVSSLLDQLDSLLDDAKKSTSTSATNVSAIKSDLETVSTDISSVASSNTLRDLSDTLGTNAASIASFMASPTSIETQAVYPVASYGSAMAPLFTNLALWIGAFSLVLLLKLDVDEEGIGPTSSADKYMGRWMLLASFGVIQALVVSTGDLIIGVQTVSRPAFVGTSIMISLVFTSIVYMLSTCFQHIGKGLCVVIMVMQIPGSPACIRSRCCLPSSVFCTPYSPSHTGSTHFVRLSRGSTDTPTWRAWRFSACRRWLPSPLGWRCVRSWST